MTISRKAAICLLVTAFSLAIFTVLAFTGLFNILEMRFYDPAILKNLTGELIDDTGIIDNYISELEGRFSDILKEPSVRRSFLLNQEATDIYERSKAFGLLTSSVMGLQWVRFVDGNGIRIHYSTNLDDQVLQTDQEEFTASYKSYPETSGYIPFDQTLLSGIDTTRIIFEDINQRIIFYFPFYDSLDIYRGEALFSVSIRAIADRLMAASRVKVGDDISVIPNPKGIIIGLPQKNSLVIQSTVSSIWASGSTAMSIIDSPAENSFVLISEKTGGGIFVGRLVEETIFGVTGVLKGVLLFCFFLTVFIVLFLIVNFKQDPITVIQSRLKELQVSLLNEYYQLKGAIDWDVWRHELEQRREDVRNELKRGIEVEKGSEIDVYINSFFDKSWDDLLMALGGRTNSLSRIDEVKLEKILKKVLSSQNIFLQQPNAQKETNGTNGTEEKDQEKLEELEELTDDVTDDKTNSAGELESIADLEDLNDIKPLEDIAAAEEADKKEEPERIEEIETIEPIEIIDDIEPAEEPELSGKKEPSKKRISKIPDIRLFDYTKSDDDLNIVLKISSWEPNGILGVIGQAALEPEEIIPILNEEKVTEEAPAYDESAPAVYVDELGELNNNLEIVVPHEYIEPAEVKDKPAVEDAAESYDVAEFESVSDEEFDKTEKAPVIGGPLFTFESPHKGTDLNAVAKKIEFSAPKKNTEEDVELSLAIDSPMSLFEDMYGKEQDDFDRGIFDNSIGADGTAPESEPDIEPEPEPEIDELQEVPEEKPLLQETPEVPEVKEAPKAPTAGYIKPVHTPPPVVSALSYRPFWNQNTDELEYLEDADDEDENIMETRDGVTYIDPSALKKVKVDNSKIDQSMKNLVDSVLGNIK
ncbi:hypothetical protein AGMMS50212_12240 [Spirochaetia bacterium]|nr:hypothetical protein AGMMS50212_12240 [Spirochaetia bacterium]